MMFLGKSSKIESQIISWHTSGRRFLCFYRPVTLSPCIMCVQYRGGCSVPWGVFSTVGGVQYRGRIS